MTREKLYEGINVSKSKDYWCDICDFPADILIHSPNRNTKISLCKCCAEMLTKNRRCNWLGGNSVKNREKSN